MNRLFLLAPKTVLKQYVLDHFEDLSVEDFLCVEKKLKIPSAYFSTHKNDVLKQSSEVLSHMLDTNIEAFRDFDIEAFSIECIDKLASGNVKIKEEDLEKYPILLENNKLCEKMIRENPMLIKKMKSSQITRRIVSLLAESGYVPDADDFLRSPFFSHNEKLITRGIESHPDVILQIPDLSLNNVSVAIRSGFVPKKEHFYTHPHLRKFDQLLQIAFESDPSMISIFDKKQLSSTYVLEANSRGYVADEKDLIENSDLTKYKCIMESAIKKNPKMIVYLHPSCSINSFIIEEALQKYEITKEDLEKFPNLTRNDSIMCHFPQFRLYSAYLTEEEKQELLESKIRNDQILTIDALPFLDYRFGAKADINKLNELMNYLKISIKENDMDEQQHYFQILDKVIDGIVRIRYMKNKLSFLYSDVVSLHNDIIKVFQKMRITNNSNYLYSFVVNLYDFVGRKNSREQLGRELEKFYGMYLEGRELDLSITSDFCNHILNEHRNYFSNKEKNMILKNMESKMTLSSKKVNAILNGKKLKKITNIIIDREWGQLGITEEEFHEIIKNTEESILNNKDVRKSSMNINRAGLDILAIYFEYDGTITMDTIQFVLNGNDLEVMKFIIHKFEQIKFKFISNVSLSEKQMEVSWSEKEKLGGLNHTNYVIAEKDRYVKNLSSLLLKLNDKDLDKILQNKKFIHAMVFLLPLLGLIEELDIDTFLNILSKYDRVEYKISKTMDLPPNIDRASFILKKIDDVILLANAYNSIDNITLCALGKNIVSLVGEQNSPRYLEFYLKMLDRQMGMIPPICLQINDYRIESGFYSDPERLLIGKKIASNSCIDLLNPAGMTTYKELLTLSFGDVALFRDQQNNFLSRVFFFRKGNLVQMVTHFNERIPIEIYKKIAEEMMRIAIKNQDNIDYIFINADNENLQKEGYITLYDPRFKSCFPHADTCCHSILLSSKESVHKPNDIKLDFDAVAKKSYVKLRKKINYQPTEEEITRLRALYIIMEVDAVKREKESQDFEPFYKEEYQDVFCGEDWYIAIRKDGILEELALPSKDPRIYEEMEQIKNNLHLEGNKTL